MPHSRDGGDTNGAVLEHIADLRIDDETHALLIRRRPQQAQQPIVLEQFDRATPQSERDRRTRELWRDVRDARRSLRA